MVLEQKDVLQINATVIVGALIFLTVITITGSTSTEIVNQIHAMIIALGVIIFFSFSSIFALRGKVLNAEEIMQIGLIVLLVSAVILFIMNIGKTIEQAQKIIPKWFNGTKVPDTNITKSQSPIRTV
jgi:uncharacterized membrane protein YbhN (UPF0104 family)